LGEGREEEGREPLTRHTLTARALVSKREEPLFKDIRGVCRTMLTKTPERRGVPSQGGGKSTKWVWRPGRFGGPGGKENIEKKKSCNKDGEGKSG